MKQTLSNIISNPNFERGIIGLIVLNAIVLGLETSDWWMGNYGPFLLTLDAIILAIFVFEIPARLIVDFRGFWRDPWRIFDFLVVAIALVPASGPFAILRAFRILRVLRLISNVEAMRRVVNGLLNAVPGITVFGENKEIVFGVTALVLLASGAWQWHARNLPCPADPAKARACTRLRRISWTLWGISVAAFAIGGFFAFFPGVAASLLL